MSEQLPNQSPPERTIPESERRLAAYFAAQDKQAQRFRSKIGTRVEVAAVVPIAVETKPAPLGRHVVRVRVAGRSVGESTVSSPNATVGAARETLRPILAHEDLKGQALVDLLAGLRGETPTTSVEVKTSILLEVFDAREFKLPNIRVRPAVRVSCLECELTQLGELTRDGVDALWARLRGPLGQPLRLSTEDSAKLRDALFAL